MNKLAQTTNPLTGQPVTKEFRVKQIKSWINQMPWDHIGGNPPNLNAEDPRLDPDTVQAVERLHLLGKSLGMMSLIAGTTYVNQNNLDAAADALFDAKSELTKTIRDYEKYHEYMGSKIWSLEEKLESLNRSEYPRYFPQAWHPQNVGSYVGGTSHGQFGCRPGDKEAGEGRKPGEGACMTPYYNHFLMWGPDCERCGTNGPDPRYLRAKRRYPHLFTHEQIRARVLGKKRSFFINSPGVAPYIAPPPSSGETYKNMNDPDLLDKEVREEGLKFVDAEDARDYEDFLKAFNKFKAQELEKDETVAYIAAYFKRFPYKKKKLEHEHGPSFLDPSKLGPKVVAMTDEEELLKISTNFNKLAATKTAQDVPRGDLVRGAVEQYFLDRGMPPSLFSK